MYTVPQTKCLRITLSDCKHTLDFGIRTQARSARFRTGRVSSSLPNKIPAATQSKAFVKSSSVIRRSERPKMVSFGSLRRRDCNILSSPGSDSQT